MISAINASLKAINIGKIHVFSPVCKLYDKSSTLEIRPRTNHQLNLLIKNIKKTASKK